MANKWPVRKVVINLHQIPQRMKHRDERVKHRVGKNIPIYYI